MWRSSARYRKGTGYPPKRHLRGNTLESPGCESSPGFFFMLAIVIERSGIDHEQNYEEGKTLLAFRGDAFLPNRLQPSDRFEVFRPAGGAFELD